MEDFEKKFTRFAVPGPNRISSGFVLGAANSSGQEYIQAFGNVSLDESSPKLSKDNVMWFASCTKLVTTVAALQCVERGQFTLDEDISRVIPEWKSPQILTGFGEDGKPLLKSASMPITLRHLLTHTSGMGYDFLTPQLTKWKKLQGVPTLWECGEIKRGYYDPLLFEPGSSWLYSPGIDWAGQMVERVNGGIKLGDYLEQNIFEPLGIKDATFDINARPDLKERLVPMTERSEAGLANPTETIWDWPIDPKDHCGGAGIRTTVPEYMKFLRAILTRDENILSAGTYKLMFESNVTEPASQALSDRFSEPDYDTVQGPTTGGKWTWGLGGSINLDDIPGYRSAGTMHWNGLPNLSWWIDPVKEVCGVVATQLVPPIDIRTSESTSMFLKFVSEEFGKK